MGPDWNGKVPFGITGVFRSKTNTGFVAPRVFQNDTAEDKRAVQSVLSGIDLYPLWMFDAAETKWVFPDKFIDQLAAVFQDAPPLPGEEAPYKQVLAVIEAASRTLD